MTCKCGSTTIISINGKCRDLFDCSYNSRSGKTYEYDGYVPSGLGIGEGDYIEFDFCAVCGTIQGFEPLSEQDILLELEVDDEDDDE